MRPTRARCRAGSTPRRKSACQPQHGSCVGPATHWSPVGAQCCKARLSAPCAACLQGRCRRCAHALPARRRPQDPDRACAAGAGRQARRARPGCWHRLRRATAARQQSERARKGPRQKSPQRRPLPPCALRSVRPPPARPQKAPGPPGSAQRPDGAPPAGRGICGLRTARAMDQAPAVLGVRRAGTLVRALRALGWHRALARSACGVWQQLTAPVGIWPVGALRRWR